MFTDPNPCLSTPRLRLEPQVTAHADAMLAVLDFLPSRGVLRARATLDTETGTVPGYPCLSVRNHRKMASPSETLSSRISEHQLTTGTCR